MSIQYHPRKANMVADVLSRKSTHGKLSVLITEQDCLVEDFRRLELEAVPSSTMA